MKILFVIFVNLFLLITAQATEVKEQVGPYAITLSTALNTTVQNGTINDEKYRLNINYTIPEGQEFGQIYIEQYNDTLTILAMDFALNIIRLGYVPQDGRYEKIDGHDGVVVPYKSPTSFLPADYYQFGYRLDERTLVNGWFSFEFEGPCWEARQDRDGYLKQIEACSKSLDQLPRSLRTLHVVKT
jgi:hypothetical protein